MATDYLTKIKELPFINLLQDGDGLALNLLRIMGGVICTVAGGWAGFAIYGWLGAAFGSIFGYVTGKLLIK